ncbi:PREDICTED: uncharacterized protein LOC104590085 [Nelumbo nucifera]|uniref:Uncharacterized protein LOC104590085 n=2 Tax=Nelumbo nucifera TaxID=4432 RepID=A0A1U7Z1K0_NELNU|nr:PREDICTED: uncharacterized protein LOC104590085 [Nelumbo nucifera]
MGSLMPGWDSLVDDRDEKFSRSRSFTKEEIEAYWRSKKKTEKEHLKAISGLQDQNQEMANMDSGGVLQRSSSETDLETLMKKMDWWTRCGSAFLNEPPVIDTEGRAHKYKSQYHLTGFRLSKPDFHHGIIT